MNLDNEEDIKLFEEYKEYREIFLDFMLTFKSHQTKMHSLRIKSALSNAKKRGGGNVGLPINYARMKEIKAQWDNNIKPLDIAINLDISESCVRYNLHKMGVIFRKGRPKIRLEN